METGMPLTSRKRQFDGKFIPDLRFAHRDFEFVLIFVVRHQGAGLQACPGTHHNFFFACSEQI